MWQREIVAGIPIDLFIPVSKTRSQYAVLFLSGYQPTLLQNQAGFERAFEKWGLRVVSPVVPHCWWIDRPSPGFEAAETPHQFLLDQLLPWIEAKWNVSPPGIALLGVSTGGQGVLQVAFRHALQFPVVAAISPAIDFDRIWGRRLGIEGLFETAEEARQETAILQLHPLNWPKSLIFCSDPLDVSWHEGAQRLSSKLASSGIRHTCDLMTSHGGHGWDYFNEMAEFAVAFLAEGLEKAERRFSPG